MAILNGNANGGPATSPSRLSLIEGDQASLSVRSMYADGDPSNIVKALAGSPDTLAAMAPFLARVMNATTLDLATKEVVVLRVSAVNRCAYCVPTHRVAALRAGLSPGVVAALSAPELPTRSADRETTGLSARELTLARYCDQLVADAGAVDNVLLAEMRQHFEEHELVELTVLAGAITTLNYVASVANLPLDPGTLAAG